MTETHIRRYNRCKWMAVISAIFAAMTIALLIPGAMGISGGNHYNDILFYLALIDLLFAVLFLFGWLSCQLEVDDVEAFKHDIPTRRKRTVSTTSHQSTSSTASVSSHQLLTAGFSKHTTIKEA